MRAHSKNLTKPIIQTPCTGILFLVQLFATLTVLVFGADLLKNVELKILRLIKRHPVLKAHCHQPRGAVAPVEQCRHAVLKPFSIPYSLLIGFKNV